MTDQYISELDTILEVNAGRIAEMDLSSEEAEAMVKNLETLSDIRTGIYQAQQEAYVSELKVQQDDVKAELDKKNTIVTWITNGFTAVLYIFTAVTPFVIMNAEREGRFWSKAAMNAVERGPRLGFIKTIFKK